MANENKFGKEGSSLVRSDDLFAEIKQIDASYVSNQTNMLRIYCVSSNGEASGFRFQIRTLKPIVDGGKPRPMIAGTTLSIADVEAILSFMKEEAHKYDVKKEVI